MVPIYHPEMGEVWGTTHRLRVYKNTASFVLLGGRNVSPANGFRFISLGVIPMYHNVCDSHIGVTMSGTRTQARTHARTHAHTQTHTRSKPNAASSSLGDCVNIVEATALSSPYSKNTHTGPTHTGAMYNEKPLRETLPFCKTSHRTEERTIPCIE